MKNYKNDNSLNLNKIVDTDVNPFIQIPNEIVCRGLSDEIIVTLFVLLTFKIGKNPTFPSLKSIALKRHRSINSVSTHLKELQRLGLISYKKRGYSKSNEYFFNFPIGCDNVTPKINHTSINRGSIYKSISKYTPSTLGPNNINRNIENNNKNVCSTEESLEKMNSIRQQFYWMSKKQNVIIK